MKRKSETRTRAKTRKIRHGGGCPPGLSPVACRIWEKRQQVQIQEKKSPNNALYNRLQAKYNAFQALPEENRTRRLKSHWNAIVAHKNAAKSMRSYNNSNNLSNLNVQNLHVWSNNKPIPVGNENTAYLSSAYLRNLYTSTK